VASIKDGRLIAFEKPSRLMKAEDLSRDKEQAEDQARIPLKAPDTD
jgi:hypothetical protein